MDNSELPRDLAVLLLLIAAEIDHLSQQLDSGAIDLEMWHTGMMAAITKYQAAALLAGAQKQELDAEMTALLLGAEQTQQAYLDQFQQDAIDAGVWSDAFMARAQLYGRSIVQPYWQGATWGLDLPAYPADGSSECLMRDNCQWQIEWLDQANGDADCTWVLEPSAEHCYTCEARAARWNPLQVRGGQPMNV